MPRFKKPLKKYSDREETFLRRWYGRKTEEQIARSLGRTLRSVKIKAINLGLRPKQKIAWSDADLRTLRFYWGQRSAQEVADLIGRTRLATVLKAYQLGLSKERKVSEDGRYHYRRSKSINWSNDMLFTLRKYYPNTASDEVAAMLGVSLRTCQRKAVELGITKDPAWILEKNRRGWGIAKIRNSKQGQGNRGQWQHRPKEDRGLGFMAKRKNNII